jgi:hypothetical protein
MGGAGFRQNIPQKLQRQPWLEWWRRHHFHNDRHHTSIRHSQPNSGSARKVDDPRFHERPAIVDPNHDALISVDAVYAHSGAKGKRPVRGCQLLLIVNLSAR